MAESRCGIYVFKIYVGTPKRQSFGCVLLDLIMALYYVRLFFEEVEVTQAVKLLESWYTQRTIIESFDVSISLSARLWRRYQETGKFTRREGQGRHGLTPQREDQCSAMNQQYMARRLQIVPACNWSMDI